MSRPSRSSFAPTLAALGAAAALVLALGCSDGLLSWNVALSAPEPPSDRPYEFEREGYATSDACRSCHPREHASWDDTFHSSMTQEVTPETVLAEFDQQLSFYGRDFVLERRGDEYWVELEDIDHEGPEPRPRVWRQLVLSTGSHHFQSFWYPGGKGRKLNFLGICWRIDEQRWIPVHAAFLIPPDYQLPYDGRWNTGCHQCHSVGGEPRLRSKDGMDTRVAEFGISCEACHGPGEEHVALNRNPARRYGLHFGEERDPSIVLPTDLTPELESQVCGQCHALTDLKTEKLKKRWRNKGYTYEAGDDLTETRAFLFEGDSFFWKDGMVRLAGREFSQFLRTPCFVDAPSPEDQMGCSSCHRMHQAADDPRPMEEWRKDMLDVGMDTDAGCTQCHQEYVDEEARAAHTRHPADAASCYDCHMAYTSWSLLGACRTHEVNSPSVQDTVQAGRPNACNLCHLDQTMNWAARELNEGWGVPRPKLDQDEREIAAGVLWALRGDAGQRALAAWHMGFAPAQRASGTGWMAPLLGQLFEDPYEAVRFTAQRSLATVPGFGELSYDFLGPVDERPAANANVRARWEAGERSAASGPLLIRPDGSLDLATFERLLLERDDTPVILSE